MTMPMSLKRCPRCHGKMCSRTVQDLLARVESLEQWSNQSDILLTTLGDIMKEIEKSPP